MLKATESGNKDALFDLGMAYFEGVGVEPDVKQALAWLKKADEAGHRRAAREAKLIQQTLADG
ncbi:MAG: SEL1-like repeat protein [Candidatus Competibacteraceae bacterium]